MPLPFDDSFYRLGRDRRALLSSCIRDAVRVTSEIQVNIIQYESAASTASMGHEPIMTQDLAFVGILFDMSHYVSDCLRIAVRGPRYEQLGPDHTGDFVQLTNEGMSPPRQSDGVASYSVGGANRYRSGLS